MDGRGCTPSSRRTACTSAASALRGYKGVADLVAVRRNNQKPDEITVMLIQVKGGKARLAAGERDRLRTATKHVRLRWNVATKPGRSVHFERSIE